jgi:hypothetical protein
VPKLPDFWQRLSAGWPSWARLDRSALEPGQHPHTRKRTSKDAKTIIFFIFPPIGSFNGTITPGFESSQFFLVNPKTREASSADRALKEGLAIKRSRPGGSGVVIHTVT